MKKEQLYLSTIADDAAETAREFGLGVELAQFCLAENMENTPPEVESLRMLSSRFQAANTAGRGCGSRRCRAGQTAVQWPQ